MAGFEVLIEMPTPGPPPVTLAAADNSPASSGGARQWYKCAFASIMGVLIVGVVGGVLIHALIRQ
jgi:hypothetical protein